MAKKTENRIVYKERLSVEAELENRENAESNKKKILKNKKQEKLIENIIKNFKNNIKTMDDVRSNSSLFFVKKDGEVKEAKMPPSVMKSDLGGSIISSFINKSKAEDNEVQLVVQIFFGKGVVSASKTEEEAEQIESEIEAELENNGTLAEHELVKDYMMVEIYGKSLHNLNAFEFITSEDKKEKKTYVCISDKKNLEEYIKYSANHKSYFKK